MVRPAPGQTVGVGAGEAALLEWTFRRRRCDAPAGSAIPEEFSEDEAHRRRRFGHHAG